MTTARMGSTLIHLTSACDNRFKVSQLGISSITDHVRRFGFETKRKTMRKTGPSID